MVIIKDIPNYIIRRQKYKKFRVQGFSKYAAAIKAGYSKATAWNATKNIEKHCDMDRVLEVAGLTDKVLADHAAKGMKAMKARGDRGKIADWQVRHKYYETICKLRKKLRPDGKELEDLKVPQPIYNIINFGTNGQKSTDNTSSRVCGLNTPVAARDS